MDVYGKGTHGTVLACAVVMGNPYPVTEHPHQDAARADTLAGGSPSLLGGANVPGYDMHMAVVQRHSKTTHSLPSSGRRRRVGLPSWRWWCSSDRTSCRWRS